MFYISLFFFNFFKKIHSNALIFAFSQNRTKKQNKTTPLRKIHKKNHSMERQRPGLPIHIFNNEDLSCQIFSFTEEMEEFEDNIPSILYRSENYKGRLFTIPPTNRPNLTFQHSSPWITYHDWEQPFKFKPCWPF